MIVSRCKLGIGIILERTGQSEVIPMFSKRMKICLTAGALLGVVCIAGASVRSGFQSEPYFLFSLWYNRVILGLVIGLADKGLKLPNAVVRGAVLGLLVSFAFYSSVGFTDTVSFLAGILYGVMIEYVAFKMDEKVM